MPFGLEHTIKTWRRRRADEKLFRELCDAHALRSRQRQLLTALADKHRLVRLGEIFVRPSLFTTSPDRAVWSNDELRDLESILFAPMPTTTVPATVAAPTVAPAIVTAPLPVTVSEGDDSVAAISALLVREAIDDPPIAGAVPTARE